MGRSNGHGDFTDQPSQIRTLRALKFATAVDDMGRCANIVSKFVRGGCFVPGTLVTLSDLPPGEILQSALWASDSFLDDIASHGGLALLDGGVVDAELIRLLAWIEAYDLQPGTTMSMQIQELKVDGPSLRQGRRLFQGHPYWSLPMRMIGATNFASSLR